MSVKREWRLKTTNSYSAPMRCLAIAEGHAMVRYKGCAVHAIPETEWLSLPVCDAQGVPL